MLAQRLRQLRLAKGLTMEQLVEAAGGLITKQSVSKYELGKANPTPSVLAALAAALGVKAHILLSGSKYKIEFIAYRKTPKTSQRTLDEVEAKVASQLEARIRVKELIGNFEIPNIPKFKVRSMQDAENAANIMREHWNLSDLPISDLAGLIEDNNIEVIDVEIEDGFDGLSARAVDENGNIRGAALISRCDITGARQRFNLAHELGHLVMDVSDSIDPELAAHRFSGAFLMPASRLIKETGPKRDSIYYKELLLLKKQFKLSVQAIMYRMRDLGVITDSYLKTWYTQWNKAGYKAKEPEEFECEYSILFKQSVYRAFAENLIRKNEAEELLGELISMEVGLERPESHLLTLLRLPKDEREEILKIQVDSIREFYEPGGPLDDDGLYPGDLPNH